MCSTLPTASWPAARGSSTSSGAATTRCTSTPWGRERIPDPTTEGDFCRRFTETDVELLLEVTNEVRWIFWISNDWKKPVAQIVLEANGRCNQENLIAQLKSGCKALAMAVGNLTSNWAYMVMGSLAWTLKAWSALLLPEKRHYGEKHRQEQERLLRMEFATFVHAVAQIPCQIVRTARRIVYWLLSWNPWQSSLLRRASQDYTSFPPT